jgi:hypothetical protein
MIGRCVVGSLLLAVASSVSLSAVVDGDVYADSWVATDSLGRSLPTFADVGPPRANRQVGLFYFLWVNNGVSNKRNIPVQDITKILAANPLAPKWGPPGSFHFWGEPELGYYTIDDPFVLTRHRSMLTAAGIDTLIMDQTNALVYSNEMLAVCENLEQGRLQGLPVPKVAAIHNSSPEKSVPKLYEALYAPKKFPELWFKWLGKPLLLSNPEKLSQEMKDFFTIRHTWAWSTAPWFGNGRDKWTWVDWGPQKAGWHESPDKPEQISVCIAPHPLDGRGRSATPGQKAPIVPEGQLRSAEGIYATDQWKHALKVDPPFIFVTGWNEWIAQRQIWGKPHKPKQMAYSKLGEGDTYFVDQFNQEFSRDSEPMKNGHGDNYYYQLVANIRRYKGVRPPVVPVVKAITIDGSFTDWAGVLPDFRDFQGDTLHRDHIVWNSAIRYVNTTGRNDIVRAHVSTGKDTVAFHVACTSDISPSSDPNWMRLFIDVDQNFKTGWNGYDLLVNRTAPTEAGLSLHLIKDGKSTELSRIPYSVKGKDLELALPRSLFGTAPQLRFDFKWADNQQKDGDIVEFAINGDSAPDRRFNYRYDQTVTEGNALSRAQAANPTPRPTTP